MFISEEERKKSKNTEYLEFQICKNKYDINAAVKVENIVNYRNDSLYLDFDLYQRVFLKYIYLFDDSFHNNRMYGEMDCYGINYYDKEKARKIKDKILNENIYDLFELQDFLNESIKNNGFYILGI